MPRIRGDDLPVVNERFVDYPPGLRLARQRQQLMMGVGWTSLGSMVASSSGPRQMLIVPAGHDDVLAHHRGRRTRRDYRIRFVYNVTESCSPLA